MSCRFYTPSLLITDYYDSLITNIDIYTEELIYKYKQDDLLPQDPTPYEYLANNPWPKDEESYGTSLQNDQYSWQYSYNAKFDDLKVTVGSTKIWDYLNTVREKAIEELKKAQQFNLDHFRDNKDGIHFERENMNQENIEILKSQLFENKFCFLLKLDRFKIRFETVENKCLYRLYTIICDFYLSEKQIKYLRGLIGRTLEIIDQTKLDQKSLLIHQVKEYICGLVCNQKYGLEIIHIDLNTILSIQRIHFICSIEKDVILSLPSDINLSALKSLTLWHYGEKLNDLAALPNLEYLSLAHIKPISWSLKNLCKLIKLRIFSCDLSDFDFNILSHFFSLEMLLLEHNICDYFKIDWADLSYNLKVLCISFPVAKEVEMTTHNMYDLTVLKLVGCKINAQKADKYFNGLKLPQLTYLDISCNSLIELKQSWFYGFASLKTLILKSNSLKSLDLFQFEIFSNLEVLDISQNLLTNLHEGTFFKLTRLTKLQLTKNNISRLDANVFKGLDNLEILLMDSFTNDSFFPCVINKDAFSGLNNLSELDLRYNNLRYIHKKTFTHTPKLISLNLYSNKLKLKWTLFSSLKNLKFLDLRCNLNSKDPNLMSSLKKLSIKNIKF